MVASVSVLQPPRGRGIFLVLTGAILWGVSGTVAQYLFHKQGFSPEWLVVTRLLISGLILLAYSQLKMKQSIWKVWHHSSNRKDLILFGLFGMLAVQYTYFAAIHHGNAATATVLQYLAPVIIAGYLTIRSKVRPANYEVVAIIIALLGTFLLVTGGKLQSLAISAPAVFWGISSAFALAYYTLQPGQLLKEWGSILTVGWGMMIGGIGFSIVNPPWEFTGTWSLPSLLAVIFVVIFGTLIAFYCYLESLKYISPSETSLLASAEPLSAAFLAVVWLNVPFGWAEWFGTLFIISTIFILSLVKSSTKISKAANKAS